MATIVNSIGTSSRDYSTIQAWEDAIPSTPSDAYEGHCYNDSEFSGRAHIAGHATSSTNYIRLTAAAGQSWQDHASIRSNAFYYDQSKGVGIHANPGTAGSVVDIDCDNVLIDRLQIKRSVASYTNTIVNVMTNNFPNVVVKDSIIEKAFSANVPAVVIRCGKAINLLVVNTGSTVGSGLFMYEYYGNRGRAINCTIVNLASSGGNGIESGGLSSNDNFINNCAVFGYGTASNGSPQGDYNATNLASGLPGAHSLFNLVASNQFQNSTNDFRLKAGSALINAGNTDATNAPNDATGFARGSGTAGDIGAWEVVGTSVTITDADDELFYNGESIVITGSNFGASQGTAKVYICPSNDVNDAGRVEQTITAWSDTSATIAVVRNSLAFNTNLYLFVKNNAGANNASGRVVQLQERPYIRQTFIDLQGAPRAGLSGLTLVVYHAVPTFSSPNPAQVIEGVSLDGTGQSNIGINRGSLALNAPVWIGLMKDGTPAIGTLKKVTPVYE